MTEFVDHRYLGALQCVDRATGAPLAQPLRIEAAEVRFFRNRSNLYVIAEAPGLYAYSGEFANAPDTPATASIEVEAEISDPLNQYLPRRVQIALPRDANPDRHDQPDSVFQPLDIALYAAPNARLRINWSTIRVAITRSVDGEEQPVAGALLRVVRSADNEILSSGLSDPRGEALVVIPGIPITRFADEDDTPGPGAGGPGGGGPGGPGGNPPPVVVSETAVTVEVSVLDTAQWPVDTDRLELNHASNIVASESLTLRTGRMEKLTIQLTS